MSRKPLLGAAAMKGAPYHATSRRATRALEGWRTAAEAIGQIGPETSLFVLTRGQISMIDVVQECVKQLQGTDSLDLEVSVWTWCIADYEVQAFEWLLASGAITAARLIVDRSAEVRNAELIERWRAKYGARSVRVCANHAKVATISNRRLRVAVRGSMNLNFNPRFEQFDLSVNDGVFDLIKQVETDLPVLAPGAGITEARDASQVRESFSDKSLALFGGVKVWAK